MKAKIRRRRSKDTVQPVRRDINSLSNDDGNAEDNAW